MQVVRVRLSAKAFFFPSFTVFGLLFCFLMVFNFFFTYWLVSLYSYGWLFTAARVVAINVFLVCYRKLLCSWPNFKRHREFFLSEFFSRFVAYPVPSPQIVGTSRKQGEGKIRPAWYWEGGSAPFLSSRFPPVSICISFISLNITILEPGTSYLSRDKNGNFFAAPHGVRYQRNVSPPSMSNTHHLFKCWSLRF